MKEKTFKFRMTERQYRDAKILASGKCITMSELLRSLLIEAIRQAEDEKITYNSCT